MCEGIRTAIYGSPKANGITGDGDGEENEEDEGALGPGERVGIVTVAETIGFWNLSVSGRAYVYRSNHIILSFRGRPTVTVSST